MHICKDDTTSAVMLLGPSGDSAHVLCMAGVDLDLLGRNPNECDKAM